MKKSLKSRTKMVHAGHRRSQFNEVSEAVFLTQSYVYDSAEQAQERFDGDDEGHFIYARYGNPTVAMFQERVALLEGAEAAFATASGMAAVSGALLATVKAGDHVVAARALFGSCLYIFEEILPRNGVEVTFVDGTDLKQWAQAVRADTRLVFFETISNPTLEVIDLSKVAQIAHANGALVMVDNVFSTPVFSRALEQGADVVIYSATKHIDGQGRMLGGVILSDAKFISGTIEPYMKHTGGAMSPWQGRMLGGVILSDANFISGTIEPYMKHTGGAMSPFTAWVMLKGLETIELRVRAQAETAALIAQDLSEHSALTQLIYPGHPAHAQYELAQAQLGTGGTLISVELKGGQRAAFAFLNALQIILISNNLGDAKSIATHPATTTHHRLPAEQKQHLGISAGLIRISIGLEDSEDLIDDLRQALAAAQAACNV